MEKRKGFSIYAEIAGEDGMPSVGERDWVPYSDYAALLADFKEALDEWKAQDNLLPWKSERIAELRKKWEVK